MDKERLDKLMLIAQLAFAELLDSELYQPMKAELKEHNITHSLGFKKEMFKHNVERLFENLKKDLVDCDKKDRQVVDSAVAFMDNLNSFNDITHPEVYKRALELQKAVAEYLKPELADKKENIK